jgi:hypothetical protein
MAACVASEPPGGSEIDRNGGPGNGGGGGGTGGSGTSIGGGSDAPSITSAVQFLSALENDDCNEAFSCASTYAEDNGGDSFSADYGATVADCVSGEAQYDMPSEVAAEIAAGRILFDAADASECVAGITSPGNCATYWNDGLNYPDACDTALIGTIADGGACVVDYDCANLSSVCLDGGTCGPEPGSSNVVVESRGPRTARVLATLHR